MEYRYFKSSEFIRCTPSCSIEQMDESFMKRLDDARAQCSVPFVINSAYRSESYERSKGRKGTSSHCKGLAVDLACKNDRARLQMALALLAVGFRRLGIYSTFIHVDMDTSKAPCIWTK